MSIVVAERIVLSVHVNLDDSVVHAPSDSIVFSEW